MVHVQTVKSVWSTLHKELLQMVGNKQQETECSMLCLEKEEEQEEKEEEENGAAERTQDAFSLNFLKQ